MEFNGIYTPVITPYNEDYSINWTSMEEVLEFLINAGVEGIVIAGTTGEYYAQTPQERVEMMTFAKNVIKDRTNFVVGTGATRTEDSIYFGDKARAAGANAIMITTPPYACPTGREIAEHSLAVDKAVNLPVILYNYPGRMGVNMDKDTFDILVQNSNFCAIKESSGDINRLHMLVEDYSQIQLSCGMDDQALEFFAWGATSWVCPGSNFAPFAHKALYQTCVLENDIAKGRRIMSAMLPLMQIIEQGGKFIQCVKHGVKMQGIDAGPPRLPLQPANDSDLRELEDVITTMNATIQEEMK